LLASVLVALCAAPAALAAAPGMRDVLLVGNNWDGSADVIDVHTFERIRRIDIVPDLEQRTAEIALAPDRLVFFLAIRQEIGEGHAGRGSSSPPRPRTSST
jgi:hypothetical protein